MAGRPVVVVAAVLLLASCGSDEPGALAPIREVAADGATLRVTFLMHPDARCERLVGVEVEKESATTVRVAARTVNTAGDAGCTSLAMPRVETVTLDAPLGDRTVVDASTGRTVEVTGR